MPADASFLTLGGEQPAARFGPADASVLIAIAPALGIRADYYTPLAELLVARGAGRVAVLTFDLLGTGRSAVRASRRTDWGYEALRDQFAALRAASRAIEKDAAFVWLGHSLGGQIALLDGEHADAVILVASGSPYFRAWEGLGKLRLFAGTTLSAMLAQVLGYFPGERVGFGGREAKRWAAEWARLSRTGSYRFEDFDGESALSRASMPVLSIDLEGDPLAPRAAMEHTLGKLGSTRVTRRTWARVAQDERMRTRPHDRWPRSAGFVVAEALAFLEGEGILAR